MADFDWLGAESCDQVGEGNPAERARMLAADAVGQMIDAGEIDQCRLQKKRFIFCHAVAQNLYLWFQALGTDLLDCFDLV